MLPSYVVIWSQPDLERFLFLAHDAGRSPGQIYTDQIRYGHLRRSDALRPKLVGLRASAGDAAILLRDPERNKAITDHPHSIVGELR